MKKSPSSNLQYQSSQRKKNPNFQDITETEYSTKRNSGLRSFISIVKKLALIFSSKSKKTASNVVGSDDRKNTSKARLMVSCKYDQKEKNKVVFLRLFEMLLLC